MTNDEFMERTFQKHLRLRGAGRWVSRKLGSAPDAGTEDMTDAGVQPVGRVRLAETELRGALSKDQIRTTIRDNIDSVRACYTELSSGEPFHGRLVMHMTIGPRGTVDYVELASNSTGLDALPCCVAEATKSWKFPKPEGGGIVIIHYPFAFRDSSAQ